MGMKMCFEFQSSLFLLRQFYMHLVGHWAHWRHFLTVRSQSLNYLVENACVCLGNGNMCKHKYPTFLVRQLLLFVLTCQNCIGLDKTRHMLAC